MFGLSGSSPDRSKICAFRIISISKLQQLVFSAAVLSRFLTLCKFILLQSRH